MPTIMIRAFLLQRLVDDPLEFASALMARRPVERSLRLNAETAENRASRPGGQKCSGT